MKISMVVAATLVAAGFTASAHAQDPRSLSGTCTACHGTEGRSVGGIPPALAGRDRNDLLQALKDFKAGKRPATIMHQLAKGYTDEQIEQLATYFSNVKP
jgi:cytochrome c553